MFRALARVPAAYLALPFTEDATNCYVAVVPVGRPERCMVVSFDRKEWPDDVAPVGWGEEFGERLEAAARIIAQGIAKDLDAWKAAQPTAEGIGGEGC